MHNLIAKRPLTVKGARRIDTDKSTQSGSLKLKRNGIEKIPIITKYGMQLITENIPSKSY